MINKRNSLLATTQRQGIQNKYILQSLAFFKEYCNGLNIFRLVEVLGIILCWVLIFKWS